MKLDFSMCILTASMVWTQVPLASPSGQKYPLYDTELWLVENVPMIRATIDFNDQLIRLYNVHPPPPLFKLEQWNRIMSQLVDAIADEQGDLIVMGDFNITPQNKWYKQFTNGRLRDAHLDRGRGWATTWPNGNRPAPPTRLDHAFLSPEIICLDIQEGIGMGSDHKPLILDVALH